MRRPPVGALGLCLALTFLPTVLQAQAQGRTCRQVLPSDFRRLVNSMSQEIVYFRDPVRFLCTGDVRLEADSAVVNRATSTVELVGDVVYRDSIRQLTADWANYIGREEQLLARGSTVLRDLVNGAIVEGENLNYLRETETRPLARMIVTGGRPHAIIPPETVTEPDTVATDARIREPDDADPLERREPADLLEPPDLETAPDTTEPPGLASTPDVPTEVWADRMELEGGTLFRSQGDVELERGDMTGAGDSAVFDRAADRMTLTGNAFVRTEEYRLDGDRIDAFLEGEDLREVVSSGAARLASEELNVRAQTVRIGFEGGEVQRLEAWNPDATEGAPRARADARDFRLRADSIDAQADSTGIRELRAVGRAYGERDLQAEAAQDPTEVLPAELAHDWIQGDTVLAFFTRSAAETIAADADAAAAIDAAAQDPAADPAADPAEVEVALERIVVVGGEEDALSLYRMVADDGTGRPAVNFMRASRIILFMEQGDVTRVEAEGPIEGLYLEPVGGEEAGA